MKALRVLLVEDEALLSMLMADVLKDMGHDVCAIESSEGRAVAAAARCLPDLMIVDVHLGEGGSGAAAVAEILRTGFVPHVFVSGSTLRDYPLSPKAVVLLKPFVESDLARAIQRALDTSSAY